MAYLPIGKENAASIELHFHDHGSGQPVVLIHGWPLSERSWENQEGVLLAQGYRVITYDRRGFGESSKPATGYDYDTLADDLNALMTKLDLKDAILVGFSMGTGEVARYLATYGSERVAKAVFISGILPALLKAEDNKEGVDQSVFDGMIKECLKDRPKFLRGFVKNFYAQNMLGANQVSDEVRDFSWMQAVMASPIASVKCISAWLEDFRNDVSMIKVPSLVIHGDSDQICPIKATGYRLRDSLENCNFVEINAGPHGILVSHADEVNEALLAFFATKTDSVRADSELRH